jgi:hypothetical protein
MPQGERQAVNFAVARCNSAQLWIVIPDRVYQQNQTVLIE